MTLPSKLAYIELSFNPNVELVTKVRQFVEQFCDEALEDADLVARVALAAHELLENAVKFATNEETRIRVEVSKGEQGSRTAVVTRNQSSAENIAIVRKLIEEIMSAENPLLHYQAMIRKSSKRVGGSGLGLGRIRAEGEMSLRCQTEGEVLVVSAVSRNTESREE